MSEALALVEKWCRHRANSRSYPPSVLNITDGEVSVGPDSFHIDAKGERI